MRFLLRMAFWLAVVSLLLPGGGSQRAPKVNVSAVDAVSGDKATVGDMGSLCPRRSDACTIGSQTAAAFGQRAQAGARMLYRYFNERLAPHAGSAVIGAEGQADARLLARPSQHTLSPADLAPAWRGPPPHPGARRDAPGSPPSS